MKIEWGIDGCYRDTGHPQYYRRILEIPDDQFEGLDEVGRNKLIDEWIEEDFKNQTSRWWNIIQ